MSESKVMLGGDATFNAAITAPGPFQSEFEFQASTDGTRRTMSAEHITMANHYDKQRLGSLEA